MRTCSLHGRNTNEEQTIASWTAEVANLAGNRSDLLAVLQKTVPIIDMYS